MRKVFLSLVLAFFISLSIVGATVTQDNQIRYGVIEDNGVLTTTNNQITNSYALGFVCSDPYCNTVTGTLWNGQPLSSGSNSKIVLTYPTELQDYGYGIYFYKEGYIPFEVNATWAGSGSADQRTRYLTRKYSCTAQISDLIVSNNEGDLTIKTNVTSPLTHGGQLNYVPNLLQGLYTVEVSLVLSITGSNNVEQSRELNLPFSSSSLESFSIQLDPGNYTIKITSSVPDQKCLSSIAQVKSYLLNIPPTPPVQCNSNADCPATTYSNNFCSANGIVRNATSYQCINSGTTQSACVPTTNQELVQCCQNACSNGQCTVNQCDSTPPGQVSNLRVTAITNTSLTWRWVNPSDQDFAGAIVFIDDINVLNTTLTMYTSFNLLPNSTHTISIKTKDASSNINNNAVSNTATTLANTPGNQTNETIICNTNLDCGTDFNSNLFCSNNNVNKNQTTFQCINQGTINSFCSTSVSTQLNETCQYTCSNDQCQNQTITCNSNSDCNDNNSSTADICVNPGTTNSYCSNIPTNGTNQSICGNNILEQGEQCDDGNTISNDGCSNVCATETITCNSNSDCNDNDSTTRDLCFNPGRYDSYCSNDPRTISHSGSSDYLNSTGFGLYSESNKNSNYNLNLTQGAIQLNYNSDDVQPNYTTSSKSPLILLILFLSLILLAIIIILVAIFH